MSAPTTAEVVAQHFLTGLRETLTPTQYREACVLNAGEARPGVCHSHDHCDANMVMVEAFAAAGVPSTTTLWNQAWELAKAEMRRQAALPPLGHARVIAVCPSCGFDGNVISYGVLGGYESAQRLFIVPCEECGTRFALDADQAHVVQHDGLRLLGEEQ